MLDALCHPLLLTNILTLEGDGEITDWMKQNAGLNIGEKASSMQGDVRQELERVDLEKIVG